MKRFFALTIALFLTFAVLFTFASCAFENPNGNHNGFHSDTEKDVYDTESDSNNSESESNTNDDINSDSYNNDEDNQNSSCTAIGHSDDDKNDYCDKCDTCLIVVVDFYAINDLHGKFCDNDGQPGVDELGTYFEMRSEVDEHIVLLSSGDMWQGSAESVLTNGKIMIDWMNELGFASMTLGNHEFDWGEEIIKENLQIADFPFLAINVYNKITGEIAEYCSPSVIIDRGGIQIGIIGAIGDCYSSISSDMVTDVYFKTGDELTNLVKTEAQRLRSLGVDIIVYSIHDGLENSSNNFEHYDSNLSNGYVDVVFEGHTHNAYIKNDNNGIVHIQGGAENYGLSHVEIAVNSVTGVKNITAKDIITNSSYAELNDHVPTEMIEDKYSNIIDYAYTTLGTVSKKHFSSEVTDYIAELYLDVGEQKWGEQYDIVLGGGFLQTRFPYDLSAGAICYADILSLLPFNNRIVLCKVSGSKLNGQFINSTNKNYHIALNDGFAQSEFKSNGIYYVVVDTYTALYRYNGLTIVDYYDQSTYARDLLAQAIKDGKLNTGGSGTTVKPEVDYKITPIQTALQIGEKLNVGEETTEYLYFKGTLSGFTSLTYGNCYLTDESGTEIYVYGLKDQNGNRYDTMSPQPTEGDVVIVCSTVKKYKYSSGETIIELINSIVIAINP